MFPLLPRWNLMPNRPTFFDTDSKTMLELASTLHSSMNDLITDYNTFVDNVNNKITEFVQNTEQDQETFQVAIRQEFQDFIDTIDLKMKAQDKVIADAENYLKNNIANNLNEVVENALANKDIMVETTYNSETEALSFIITGG